MYRDKVHPLVHIIDQLTLVVQIRMFLENHYMYKHWCIAKSTLNHQQRWI